MTNPREYDHQRRSSVELRGLSALKGEKAERQAWGVVLVIFGAGLALRLVAWYALSGAGEGWDAIFYFRRAVSFHDVFAGLIQGELPKRADLGTAYSTIWPPVHSALMGLGMLIFGTTLDGAPPPVPPAMRDGARGHPVWSA